MVYGAGVDASVADALTIGQISARTGLSVHALRFYEREGLFATDIARTGSGRRVYRQSDVEWLHVCNRLRKSGMPLQDIRRYAQLVSQGPGNERERFDLLEAHQARVEAQLVELQEHHRVISAKVTAYAEHLAAGSASTLWTGEPAACELGTAPASVRQ